MERNTRMTDYSKIDFTQLELEPIDSMKVDIELRAHLSIALNGWIAARRDVNDWVITSGSNGLVKRQVDELWKRTEQVDEFIRQRSRRRVTTIQLARELIDNEREICVQARYTIGAVTRYRFNRSMCRFEFYDAGCWNLCADLGDHNLFVTIIN